MQNYTFDDLLYLMQRLRASDGGCSWDLKQNYLSITPSTIEEVYEVVDTIEREDWSHLKEELGDLLFQIVFYAQLANEDGYFDFAAIVHAITDKLVRRHPHVFPNGVLREQPSFDNILETEAVVTNWEQIKHNERQAKGCDGVLDDVPLALPALQRAQKLQKRVSKAGMDFSDLDQVFAKLEEEITELKQAVAKRNKDNIEEELGDVLFCCTNLARHLKCDADQSLRRSNNKFVERVETMEQLLKAENKVWSDCDDVALESLWQQSKALLKCDGVI